MAGFLFSIWCSTAACADCAMLGRRFLRSLPLLTVLALSVGCSNGTPEPREEGVPLDLAFTLDLDEVDVGKDLLVAAADWARMRLAASGISDAAECVRLGDGDATIVVGGVPLRKRELVRCELERALSVQFMVRAQAEVEERYRERLRRSGLGSVIADSLVVVADAPTGRRMLVDVGASRARGRVASGGSDGGGSGNGSGNDSESPQLFGSTDVESVEAHEVDLPEPVEDSGNAVGGRYFVSVALVPARRVEFSRFTSEFVGRELSIVLEGIVVWSGRINAELPGVMEVREEDGGFERRDAEDLVHRIRLGTVGARLRFAGGVRAR